MRVELSALFNPRRPKGDACSTPPTRPSAWAALLPPLALMSIHTLLYPTWRAAEQQDPDLLPPPAGTGPPYHRLWEYSAAVYSAWPSGRPLVHKMAYWVWHLPALAMHTTVLHWSSSAALLVVCLACSVLAAALLRLDRRGVVAVAAFGYSIGMALFPIAYTVCQGEVDSSLPCTAYSRHSLWQCPPCTSAQRAVQVGGVRMGTCAMGLACLTDLRCIAL